MENVIKARAKSRNKRRNILDAAAKVLAGDGYAAMTLQNVAEEIGIYAASIYYYFPSREDLVREVAVAALDKYEIAITEALDALPPRTAPIDRLKHAIRSIVLIYTSQNDYFVAYERMVGQLPGDLSSEIRQYRLGIRGIWNGLIEDAQSSGAISTSVNLRLLRFMILGTTHWISQWYDPDGELSPDAIAAEYVEMILHGVSARPA